MDWLKQLLGLPFSKSITNFYGSSLFLDDSFEMCPGYPLCFSLLNSKDIFLLGVLLVDGEWFLICIEWLVFVVLKGVWPFLGEGVG